MKRADRKQWSAVLAAEQVTVVDPAWGRNTLLWSLLDGGVRGLEVIGR
jgi:hypothetical protein